MTKLKNVIMVVMGGAAFAVIITAIVVAVAIVLDVLLDVYSVAVQRYGSDFVGVVMFFLLTFIVATAVLAIRRSLDDD